MSRTSQSHQVGLVRPRGRQDVPNVPTPPEAESWATRTSRSHRRGIDEYLVGLTSRRGVSRDDGRPAAPHAVMATGRCSRVRATGVAPSRAAVPPRRPRGRARVVRRPDSLRKGIGGGGVVPYLPEGGWVSPIVSATPEAQSETTVSFRPHRCGRRDDVDVSTSRREVGDDRGSSVPRRMAAGPRSWSRAKGRGPFALRRSSSALSGRARGGLAWRNRALVRRGSPGPDPAPKTLPRASARSVPSVECPAVLPPPRALSRSPRRQAHGP